MEVITNNEVDSFAANDLLLIISAITHLLPAEKIFLLKANANQYHLLVLLPGNTPHGFREYHRRVQNACSNVVLWCIHAGEAGRLLRQGHLFYSLHCTADTLVYDTGHRPLPQSSQINPTVVVEKARAAFHRSFSLAQAFFGGAQYYAASGQARAAAFSLHQAAEQGLRALLLAVMQYNPYGHDLRGLLRRYSLFGPELFRQDEQPLLTLLNDAYMHTRYKSNYSVNAGDLALLLQKIAGLQAQVQQLFEGQLTAFRSYVTDRQQPNYQ